MLSEQMHSCIHRLNRTANSPWAEECGGGGEDGDPALACSTDTLDIVAPVREGNAAKVNACMR